MDNTTGSTVIRLDASYDKQWDKLVAASPQGNSFLETDWLRMLVDTSKDGLQVDRVGCLGKDGTLKAGWALPFQIYRGGTRRSFGFGLRYSGPLLDASLTTDPRNVIHRGRTLSDLSEYALTHYDLVVAEAHPALQDLRMFIYDGWRVVPEYMHAWDLRESEANFGNMNAEKRREIRRGLEAYRYGRDDITDANFDEFMRLYQTTMQLRHEVGLGSAWTEQFRTRIRWMDQRDGCRLYTARSETGELMAGVTVLMSPADQTAYYWMAAYDQVHRDSRLVPALYWYVGQQLIETVPEFHYANLGTSPQKSLCQFKDFLGASPVLRFTLLHERKSLRSLVLNSYEQAKNVLRRYVHLWRAR